MLRTAPVDMSLIFAKNPKGLAGEEGLLELFGKFEEDDWPPIYAFPALSSATEFTWSESSPPKYVE
jgi:hypothetical protein